MSKDRVFSEPRSQIVDFAFDETVAAVFPDMIRRSVPGYELVVPMAALLTARHVANQSGALVYDLGCSLGATTLALLKALEALGADASDLVVRAVDNSQAMLAKARQNISDPRVEFVAGDVRTLDLQPSAAVMMNWLMQFLPPDDRDHVLRHIRRSLEPDGLLIVSEKVHSDDPDEQAFCDAAHLDFKRANGYSELEISQKRTALEEVMITDTIDDHLNRFSAAGFSRARVWYRCLNWASFAASP
jgi:tRNA (cmo5U34)-methyltransferase